MQTSVFQPPTCAVPSLLSTRLAGAVTQRYDGATFAVVATEAGFEEESGVEPGDDVGLERRGDVVGRCPGAAGVGGTGVQLAPDERGVQPHQPGVVIRPVRSGRKGPGISIPRTWQSQRPRGEPGPDGPRPVTTVAVTDNHKALVRVPE
jgi:hypothetical protein